jgi:hypothetical protein
MILLTKLTLSSSCAREGNPKKGISIQKTVAPEAYRISSLGLPPSVFVKNAMGFGV